MNNKGFAISTMLYGLIIIIALVMVAILSTMAFNRKASKEFSTTIIRDLENAEKVKMANIRVGSYIKMTPPNNSYTVLGTKTGTYSDTVINPSELNLWRVINKNDDGTIDIVSQYVSSVGITFSSTVGYGDYVGVLNEISQQYENPNYTVASRGFGYDGQIEYVVDTSNFNKSKNTTSWTASTPSTEDTLSENETLGQGDTKYKKDRDLVRTAIGDLKGYNVKTPTSATAYCVASRYYYYQNGSNYSFRIRYINNTGALTAASIIGYNGSWGTSEQNLSIRPILVLKSGLNPALGDGSSVNPFILE